MLRHGRQALTPLSLSRLLIFYFSFVLRKSHMYPWTASYCIPEDDLELLILLASPTGFRDCRHVPLCLATIDFFSDLRVRQVFASTEDYTLFHVPLLSYHECSCHSLVTSSMGWFAE